MGYPDTVEMQLNEAPFLLALSNAERQLLCVSAGPPLPLPPDLAEAQLTTNHHL